MELLHELTQELTTCKQAFLYSGHSSRWTGHQKSPTHSWPTLRERAQPQPLTWDTWLPPQHHAIPPVPGGGASLPSPDSQTRVHILSTYPSRRAKPQPVCIGADISHLLVCARIQVSTAHLGPQQCQQLPWEAHQVEWMWLVLPFVPGSAQGSTPRGEEVKGEERRVRGQR